MSTAPWFSIDASSRNRERADEDIVAALADERIERALEGSSHNDVPRARRGRSDEADRLVHGVAERLGSHRGARGIEQRDERIEPAGALEGYGAEGKRALKRAAHDQLAASVGQRDDLGRLGACTAEELGKDGDTRRGIFRQEDVDLT